MKKFFFFLVMAIMIALPVKLRAQSADNEDEVVKIDKMNQRAYREGEIIVKFKEDGKVQMRAPQKTKFKSSEVNAVDALFATLGVDTVEELMPITGSKKLPKRIKAYSGKDIEPAQLGKLYRIKLKDDAIALRSIYQVVDTLKALEEVEYVEPNYIVYALSSGEGDSATYVNEPLYSQQWGLSAINLPYLWNQPKVRTKRTVIAILDTGVDIEHPDLAANIWTNEKESAGIAKQDDDNNGFVDDLHGWDFINQTGVMHDFNGHGTHCAGIAAAVGDNGIGITGADPDALIMPITVMQSDGTGDVATIIKGIDYAAANGADILSMSFGGYGYSIAEEQALGRAYATAVLVAAAGNDFRCIYAHDCSINKKSALQNGPMYPAAFTFVLGVEASAYASDGLAGFSNFDHDGPIFSTYGEERLYNYELRAPGVNILSTFPNGRYKVLNGTSMACPLAAGAISRLLQCKTDSAIVSKEVLFGDLIHSRSEITGNIDMQKVYDYNDSNRTPTLWLVGNNMVDSLGDNDGRYDAGDTIALYPIIRNDWGMAQNIKIWMQTGYYMDGDWVWDDTTLVHYLTDTVEFGKPLSSYAKAKSLNPIRFAISKDCADGRHINLTLFATCDNMSDTLKQYFTIQVEHHNVLPYLITETFVIHEGETYYMETDCYLRNKANLVLEPGAILIGNGNSGYIDVGDSCHFVAHGRPGNLIKISKVNNITSLYSPLYTSSTMDNYDSISYVIATNFVSQSRTAYHASNCIFANHIRGYLTSCYLGYDNDSHMFIDKNGISDFLPLEFCYNACNFCCEVSILDYDNIKYSNVIPSGRIFYYYSNQIDSVHVPYNYYYSSNTNLLHEYVNDRTTFNGLGYYDLSTLAKQPNPEAHGIVWRVVIDGYDAQDEFEMLPPLGVGTHKCEVYFNRGMDTLVTPYISYGVRPPYTQHAITENGSWSADSTIYTAYFTIDGKTVSDGLNRLYVADAQDDEHFEIPIENYRFNMEIAAAGSMSTGLMATPGLGKVTLNWETDEEDFEDLLGYNIYRWTNDTVRWNRYYDSKLGQYVEAGWKFDTICINTTLIDSQDTAFVDYEVVPGKTYYYVIKQITTSLNSYELSNPVVATPLTAVKGDANGSMSVDVADVVTEIAYLTNQNPQPFIYEAADVNSDNTINILDVVSTINIIMRPASQTLAIQEGTAYFYIEDGILYVESDVALGGVQLTFKADKESAQIRALSALAQFEQMGDWLTEDTYRFMAYSMSGKTIAAGKTALLQIDEAELESIILADVQGHNVVTTPMVVSSADGITTRPCINKVIEDQQIYIIYGNKKYNVLGVEVKGTSIKANF